VGPDNGLFDIVGRRARSVQCWDIIWRPLRLSSTFHGRDLYAPVAAQVARGSYPPGRARDWRSRHDWPEDLAEIIYFDRFGNAMTGLRAASVRRSAKLKVKRRGIPHARTFSAVRKGQPFWYENSSGLVEIAVNRGSAREVLGLETGDAVELRK
jgi:S-adenosylmethionine hydrolase